MMLRLDEPIPEFGSSTPAGDVGTRVSEPRSTTQPPPRPPTRAGLRRILATLCVTQIVSWGVLYYAFPVLVTDISTATGWSSTVLTAGFSAGLLTAAFVGVPVGRRLDRHGPRWTMTAGSALAGPAVVVIAVAPNPAVFAAGWLIAGVAMGAVLYPPAFAALTRWYGPERIKALTILTLAAGLASTVFAPLTALLTEHLDWRATYLVLAMILTTVTVPGHWWGLRGSWPEPEHHDPAGSGSVATPTRIMRSLPFLALLISLGMASFTAYAVVISLVPMLIERGLDTGTAALALGLGGVGQVIGRLGYPALTRRVGLRTRTTLILLVIALTTALLGQLTTAAALTCTAVVAGMARGLLTLLQATAVTDRWGTAHYGRLTGVLSAPITIAVALAPWAGTALAGVLGGYAPAFLVLAVLGLAGAGIALASTPNAT